MIDHMSTYATDFIKTKVFYQAVFSALDITLQAEFTAQWNNEWPTQRICAFGPEEKAVFWIIETKEKYTPRHVAFAAGSRSAVDEFYKKALENGGVDNGQPGLRPEYHDHYYGGFVIDPDGNDVEAVCHDRP